MKVAIIRQEQTGSDGGAQAIIDLMLQALNRQEDISLSLICRKWESEQQVGEKVIIDPPYKGRKDKQTSFNRAVTKYLNNNPVDVIQSHERLEGCHIFRAGDGVHKVWLQHKARVSNTLQGWWLSKSPYHKALQLEEKRMFESPTLQRVICNSNMVRQEIIDHFKIDKEKVVVIYNGVNTDFFTPATSEQKIALRKKLAIPQNALVFIFSGSGFERKNLAATIKAFSKLDTNCYLMVVGRDKHQQRYERLAQKLGCEKRVLFLGAQKKERMPTIYQTADVLVLPTLYDPFPNVILEGLASGLPCITSTSCGARDIIPQANCGSVINATDTEALSAIMGDYQNAQKRMIESNNARETALDFTKEKMQNGLLTLYTELLNSKHEL